MRRLSIFLAIVLVLLGSEAMFNWWVDPFAEVWKPNAVAEARTRGCLISQELIGVRYYSFKLDVFHHRPTRTFVVGSSRVLKVAARTGERRFANLGYPGSSPETILKLFHALAGAPRQTVYLGVEAFWFNRAYRVPETDPSDLTIARYLLSRSAFELSWKLVRQAHYIGLNRWRETDVGRSCTIGRIYPSINWRLDGSRVWGWELDPKRFPRFRAAPFDGNLQTWRNGYYADWRELDAPRVRILEAALELARDRGWQVIGFAPPEPPEMLRVLNTDPRVRSRWHAFLAQMHRSFAHYGFRWIGFGARCPSAAFPDAFHSDAACSERVRLHLDKVARSLH
jgi:hypothetical protein